MWDFFEMAGAAEKAYKCLRQVVRWAMDVGGILMADPTRKIDLPRKRKYQFKTLTAKEVNVRMKGFYAHPEPRIEMHEIIGDDLPLRPSENYALDFSDINFKTGACSINKSLHQLKGRLVEYATKTERSERVLYFSKHALQRLKELWKQLGMPKSGRIIGNFTPAAVAGRIKRFAEKHGLPAIAPRNKRHTWGTLTIENGAHIASVAASMGHSNINTTYEMYMETMPNIIKAAQNIHARAVLTAGKWKPKREPDITYLEYVAAVA